MWATGIRQSFEREIGSELDSEERRLGKLGKIAGGKLDEQRQRGKSEDSEWRSDKGTADVNAVGSSSH